MFTDKDVSIFVQVAYKAAAELYQGSGNVDAFLIAAAQIQQQLLEDIKTNTGPAAGIIQTAVANLHQGGVATTPVSGDGAPGTWPHLMASPDEYWNNSSEPQASLNGGNRPDFKHKDSGKGLWLKGKSPTPAGLIESLVQRGLVRTGGPAGVDPF